MTSKTRSEAPEPTAVLRGQRRYLYLWRLRGAFTRVAQQLSPASWWDRRVVPGHLVVVAWSRDAISAVEHSLTDLRRNKSFKVLEESTTGDSETAPQVVSWHLRVPEGMEEPVLRELEYRVADTLAQAGGYAGINRRLSLRAARRVMAAHQSRRTYAIAASSPNPVELTPVHQTYRNMIVKSPAGTRPVRVAVIDTNVDLGALGVPNAVIGSVNNEAKHLEQDAHGAMTLSVIAEIAESPSTVQIVLYPALSKKRKDEGLVNHALVKLCAAGIPESHAPGVLVMALAIDFPKWRRFVRTDRDTVETLLGILASDWVIVAAAGNRDQRWRRDDARYPGTSRYALMVGAVDSQCKRAEYSCFRLTDARPAAFLVAPGGTKQESPVKAGDFSFDGTSVATAYAAGVIARSIGAGADKTNPGSVHKGLIASSYRWPGHGATEHGSGLIKQVDL